MKDSIKLLAATITRAVQSTESYKIDRCKHDFGNYNVHYQEYTCYKCGLSVSRHDLWEMGYNV